MSTLSERNPAPSLARGGGLLAVATVAANAGNYALNLLLGRWLSPAEFADATLMVTLMLTLTSVALCLQLVAARFVGADPAGSARVIATLHRYAWLGGTALGLLLIGLAPQWQQLFQTSSAWPFVVLGVGVPAYLAQSVGRGILQGRFRFGWIAASLVVEMVVRLVVGVAGVAAGFGVTGATVGLSVSFLATWLVVRGATGGAGDGEPGIVGPVGRYAASVGLFMLAQIVINNGDVLVAKVILSPNEAGTYCAIALVGRAVFFISRTAATVAFPAVASRHAAGGSTTRLLVGGVASVGAFGGLCTVGALTVGGPALEAVLGPAYSGLSSLLAEYALLTTLFAMANVIASHHLSTGRLRETWLLVAGAGLQTVLLLSWANSVASLVDAQLLVVSLLLVAVLVAQLPALRPRTAAQIGDR